MKKKIESFDIFLDHVIIVLKFFDVLSNPSLSLLKKIFLKLFLSLFWTFNLLLILFEAIGFKDCNDLTCFTDRHAILFHVIGFFKWTYYLRREKEIEMLIEKMNRCHEKCQNIVESIKSKYIYSII